jgi:hypothetical protein
MRGSAQLLPKLTRYDGILLVLFLLSLPLCNPWVHGDGVGYYAYARSLLIDHNLNFEKDWKHGNQSFEMSRLDAQGEILPDQFTRTGHLLNHWSIGPALLWLPFLILTHAGVLIADKLGAHVAADGFSQPYLITMALTTALYGFLGVWISFRLACKFFQERWAFLATLGIWWASSLPVYMYFNPSWSHAHSAFGAALFLWYWHRTRGERRIGEWVVLGVISGLLVDVYYPNGMLLLVPLLEAFVAYWNELGRRGNAPASGGAVRATGGRPASFGRLFGAHVIYLAVFLVVLLPTFISRKIIFGSALATGYLPIDQWRWKDPAFGRVLWSADHGVFTWTPILLVAVAGLLFFRRTDKAMAAYLMAAAVAFYGVISFHFNWDGLSSFGNRFFVSLTPIFVLGLAAIFDAAARAWSERRVRILAPVATAVFVLWNLGMIYQWGTHLIPARGAISFREAAYNQVAVVPEQAGRNLVSYFTRRRRMMNRIEQEDVNQLRKQQETGGKQ